MGELSAHRRRRRRRGLEIQVDILAVEPMGGQSVTLFIGLIYSGRSPFIWTVSQSI